MEAGKRSYEMATLNLNDVVDEVLLSHDYHLKNLKFTVDFDRGENVLLEGDRDSIYEAVVNLLDNAIKYSADSKNIIIKTVANADSAIFSITDFGMGIPKSEQKKIFNKFYRAEDSLVHNTKGSGLGLNIVYKIMKAHNGNITMDSKPGKGSTFELHFQIKSTG
jgi:two-component system phosphate regulon sensor histidine kinase PhoR